MVEEKNVFNTTSLICTLDYQPQTDEAFKVDGRKHTHTHTHYQTNNHDKTTVVPYTLHIVKAVIDLFGDEIKEIDFWTDGSSSQYKNKYVFAFIGIKLPEIFPSLKICWNYSATSLGKGAVDGVGGTVKRLATRAIIIRKTIITRKAIGSNADSLLKAVQDKTKTILAVIDESQMKEILSDMEIPSL